MLLGLRDLMRGWTGFGIIPGFLIRILQFDEYDLGSCYFWLGFSNGISGSY
jgi:hypothetical protein